MGDSGQKEDLPHRHKSPGKLLDYSKRVVVTLALKSTFAIGLGKDDELNSHRIQEVQDYLVCAPPHLFNLIATEVMKWNPPNLRIFLTPELKALEVTGMTLPGVLAAKCSLPRLERLHLYIELSVFKHLQWELYSMLGSLRNLTQLKVFNCCSNDLLAVIGANCSHLQIFDAEEDMEMVISNVGLAFLANCKKLTHVILNDIGDEYDYEDRYLGVSAQAIAQLILALPELQVLICEPSLLRDGLIYLEKVVGNKATFPLQFFHDRATKPSFTSVVQTLCPNITHLILEEPCEFKYNLVVSLKHLCKLVLQNFSYFPPMHAAYANAFRNLESLVMRNPQEPVLITKTFLVELGNRCTNLTELSITMLQRDFVVDYVPIKEMNHMFPKLNTLHLNGDITTNMIGLFLSSVKTLKILGICFTPGLYVNADGDFDQVLIESLTKGKLQYLQTLHVSQWNVHLNTIKSIIELCPSLQHVWGLDLSMLSQKNIFALKKMVSEKNLAVVLHSGNATEPSRSLLFFHQMPERVQLDCNLFPMNEYLSMHTLFRS